MSRCNAPENFFPPDGAAHGHAQEPPPGSTVEHCRFLGRGGGGLWATFLGGRIFSCSQFIQHEAELEAMICDVRLCEHIGWPTFCRVGNIWTVLEQVSSFRARSGLKR